MTSKKYIALLRGINVSGHKLIKMEALRKSLEQLPFTNISTYIQSGNIVFESEMHDPCGIAKLIADKIKADFSFDVPVIILTPEELKEVIANHPYPDRTITDPAQPYVAFFSAVPEPENVAALKQVDFGKDQFVFQDKYSYLFYNDSPARTKLSNAIIERKLKVSATARNWKTTQKLLQMVS